MVDTYEQIEKSCKGREVHMEGGVQLREHVHSEEAYTWRKRTEYTTYITTKRTSHEGDGNI